MTGRAYPGEVDDEDFEDELLDGEVFEQEFVEEDEDRPVTPPPRRRSNGIIAAGLLGLEQALYGVRRNEIVVVVDADGMPEPDFEFHLTPDPRDSTVILHRHRR